MLLYSMDTKVNIDYLKLARGYNIRYERNTSENLPIQMITKSLEVDPRDMDTGKEEFKARLEEFKETFLIGKNKEKIYAIL